ncbi:MAG: hypothetical protein EOO90_03415 [Pedobacter sp.]|nr:MAG: hypothetical protein EOO90_03415 [Pedobacter sp.]
MENNIKHTEEFSFADRTFFLDVRFAKNDREYYQFSRSTKNSAGGYDRMGLIVFQEELPLFVQALASMCHHASHLDASKRKMLKPDPASAVKGIKSWEPDMRPREKMLADGAQTMGDAELLALLIGSGTPNETAVDLAGRMLAAFGGLEGLAKANYKRLSRFTGMGLAKCSAIIGSMELSRRLMVLHMGSADALLDFFRVPSKQ